MRLSVVVPADNSERTLASCLQAILCSSRQPDELIVVDDGRGDRTAVIAGRFPVRLITHGRNRGLAEARNTKARAARGELRPAGDPRHLPGPRVMAAGIACRLLACLRARRRPR